MDDWLGQLLNTPLFVVHGDSSSISETPAVSSSAQTISWNAPAFGIGAAAPKSHRQEEPEDSMYNERCGCCKCRLGINVGIYVHTKRDDKDAEIVFCEHPNT